ncbi:hypothetical protein ACFSR6_02500 [Pedobacter vanadiisoli]|uniref:DUF4136 domain-containing protein n=1 Tax=Pedobacter vanadiisoli TaxID=1761975 RepID=A0ABW5MDX7_9SPHI
MIIRLIAVFIIVATYVSCTKIKVIPLKGSEVSNIEIINKTHKKYLRQRISLNEDQFKLVVSEINSLKHADGEVNTKSNFGYFDLTIITKNGLKYGFDILETEYSGIVIINRQNSERYKNDRLNNLISDFFINEESLL